MSSTPTHRKLGGKLSGGDTLSFSARCQLPNSRVMNFHNPPNPSSTTAEFGAGLPRGIQGHCDCEEAIWVSCLLDLVHRAWRMDCLATSMNSFEAYCPRENNTAGSRWEHVEKPQKQRKERRVPGAGSPAVKKCQVHGIRAKKGKLSHCPAKQQYHTLLT